MGFLLLLKSILDLMGGKGVFGRDEEGGRKLFFIICGPHINLFSMPHGHYCTLSILHVEDQRSTPSYLTEIIVLHLDPKFGGIFAPCETLVIEMQLRVKFSHIFAPLPKNQRVQKFLTRHWT